jgi:hypothetical protein
MRSLREFLNEKALSGKKAEEFIKKNKSKFKDEYGEDLEEVLRAVTKHFPHSSIETVNAGMEDFINEMSTSASTTTGGVANPDAKPMFKKSKFMGHDCIDVDDKTYSDCVKGKKPFKRWAKYVEDESLRSEMKGMYQKNKKMLVRNERTGGMVFVK